MKPMDCTYEKSVGISTSGASPEFSRAADFYRSFYGLDFDSGSSNKSSQWRDTSRISAELALNFRTNVGFSASTQYNWVTTIPEPGSNSVSVWSPQISQSATFTATSGTRVHLLQVVGTCGFFKVRTNQIRRNEVGVDGLVFTRTIAEGLEKDNDKEIGRAHV